MNTNNPIHGMHGQLMAMAAHRYCLGRQSYIVGCCIEWLQAWWPEFEPGTRGTILRDTLTAIMRNEAGSPGDERDWRAFCEWAWPQLGTNEKVFCRNALAYLDKPWPLTQS